MVRLFDEIPFIEGDHIVLKQLTRSDADALGDMVRNKKVYRYEPSFLFERQFSDPHDAIRELYRVCYEMKQNLILGIFQKDREDLCGLGEFYGYKEALQKTCIGYRLREKYWGHGIATEAAGLMVDYLFSRTNIETITASTMVENHASALVLEKNGFIRTATHVPEDWGYEQPTAADKWFR